MNYEFYITPVEYKEAQQNGISYRHVNNRIRAMGWGKQRAITEPINIKRDLKKLSIAAKINGICYGTFKTRLRLGWSVEDASTIPAASRSENMKIQREGRMINTIESINRAKENGVSYGTFSRRMRDGWTLEEAINIKTLTMSECGKRAKVKWDLGKVVTA
jgi:hypothetical protein